MLSTIKVANKSYRSNITMLVYLSDKSKLKFLNGSYYYYSHSVEIQALFSFS